MNVLGRRCRQHKNGFRHLAALGRPNYRAGCSSSVADAIERERAAARRAATANQRKKSKKGK